MNAMRTEDIGELFFMGWEGDRWSAKLEKRLRTLRPGGIIFAPRNLPAPDFTAALLGRIARVLDFTPFLALEEEGGEADPLRQFFPPLPSPQAVGRRGPAAAMREGELAGAGMKLLGFNTNFAPRLDLQNPLERTFPPSQSLGSDHQMVARCGAAFVKGLKRHGILACGKYFPGSGEARPDKETGLWLSSKPMARMWGEDLEPYHKLLRHLPMVMLSHRAYKAYDFDLALPAPLSRNVLEGLLRVKLGYRGVALANVFAGSEGRSRTVPSFTPGEPLPSLSPDGEAVAKSIAAGSDMIVIRDGHKAFELAQGNLRKALDGGTIPGARVSEALKRIRQARRNIHPPPAKFSRDAFERLGREFEDFSGEF